MPNIFDYNPNQITPYPYWRWNKVLPAVYDDSLSQYELLSKLLYTVNDIINSTNTMGEQVEQLTQLVQQLIDGGFPSGLVQYVEDIAEAAIADDIETINETIDQLRENLEAEIDLSATAFGQALDEVKDIIPADDFSDTRTVKDYIKQTFDGAIAEPVLVGSMPIASTVYPQSMELYGDYLYVYCYPRTSGNRILYKFSYPDLELIGSTVVSNDMPYSTRGNGMSVDEANNYIVVGGGEDGNIVFFDATTLNYVKHVAPFSPPSRTVGGFFIDGANAVMTYYYQNAFSPCEIYDSVVYPWGIKFCDDGGLYCDGHFEDGRFYIGCYYSKTSGSVINCYNFYRGNVFNRVRIPISDELQGITTNSDGEFIICTEDGNVYNIGEIKAYGSTSSGWAAVGCQYEISMPFNEALLPYSTIGTMKVYTKFHRADIPRIYDGAIGQIGGGYNNGTLNQGGSAIYMIGVAENTPFRVMYTYRSSSKDYYLSSILNLVTGVSTSFSYNDSNIDTKLASIFSSSATGSIMVKSIGSSIIPKFFNFTMTV